MRPSRGSGARRTFDLDAGDDDGIVCIRQSSCLESTGSVRGVPQMTREGFLLHARVEDAIEVVGGPLLEDLELEP